MENEIMAQKKGNKMGAEPVAKLMATVGLPIVLSMMLQAVYNIVDSAFLSNMREAGEQALTALGLAFPVQLLWWQLPLEPESVQMRFLQKA